MFKAASDIARQEGKLTIFNPCDANVVAEKAESAVLNGYAGIEVNGEQSYGLRTHPKRSTRTTAQALITATGVEWVANVVATLKLLHAKNFKVPATLYVNFDDWFYANSTDFKANGDKTIAQRVLEIANLGQVIPADSHRRW